MKCIHTLLLLPLFVVRGSSLFYFSTFSSFFSQYTCSLEQLGLHFQIPPEPGMKLLLQQVFPQRHISCASSTQKYLKNPGNILVLG